MRATSPSWADAAVSTLVLLWIFSFGAGMLAALWWLP